jgi:DNA sulfur modification protein DndD
VKQGGDLLADRDKIEAQADLAGKQLEARAASLRKIAEGEAPLLRVTELLAEARSVVRQVADGQVASTVRDALVERDSELSVLLASCNVPKVALTKIAQFLETSRARWGHRTDVLPDLGISAAGFDSLADEPCAQLRSEIAAQLEAFEQERVKKAADIARRDAVPSKESLKAALEGVQSAQDELARTIALAEVLSVEYAKLAGQIQRAEAEVERCQLAVRELSLADEVDTRIVRHSLKARDTLARFRQTVAARNVERLENLITERLQTIMRKRDSLVDRVRIDPGSFELELRDRDGRSLDPLLLSAGERQLLAVAIVWALAKAS